MICGNCNSERLESDFIKNQKYCFRCEYQKKIEMCVKKRTIKKVYCRLCGSEVISDASLKKRQRTVFCSERCSEMGYKISRNNHWSRKGVNTWITNH